MKATTKKHIRENTRHIIPRQYFSYWYQHNNNTAFKSWFGSVSVIKHDGTDNTLMVIGEATSKKQFVDVVYDYLKLKNTQP